jgi:predicted MPP superfamily phosphohydrolase
MAAAGVGLAAGPIAYGVAYERHRLALIHADIPVSGLPPAHDGLRIGLITDIHHSATVSADEVSRAVELLKSVAADLIVLGGDYVTYGNRAYVGPVAELLSPLADTPHGAFAVLGNHDDDRDMPAALARNHFVVLKDQHTRVEIKGEPLDLVGIRFWTRRTAHVAQALKGTGSNAILLAHDPRRLTQAAELNVPAILSGHTHGGQVVLPAVGALAKTDFPILAGLLQQGNTSLFVSRGVGTVYVPLRLNCPPDVAVLTLKRKSDF